MAYDVLLDLAPLRSGSRFQGIGRYTAELVHAMAVHLAAHEYPFTVGGLAAWDRGDPVIVPLDQALDRCSSLPPVDLMESGVRRSRRRRLYRAASAAGARLLHVPEALGVPSLKSVPTVITCHDLVRLAVPHLYTRRPAWMSGCKHWALAMSRYWGARRIIACSQATKMDVVRFRVAPADKITVIPYGLDHGRFQPGADPGEREILEKVFGLPESYILFVGTGDPRKGLLELVEALAEIEGRVSLVLAGRMDRFEELPIRRAVSRLGLEGRVLFLGYVADRWLPMLFRNALVFVFPSHYEGLGLPPLEAQACGTPVVAAACPAVMEGVRQSAVLYPPGDVAALTGALEQVLADPALRRRLSSIGKANAARFSWESTAASTLEVYRQVLEGNV